MGRGGAGAATAAAGMSGRGDEVELGASGVDGAAESAGEAAVEATTELAGATGVGAATGEGDETTTLAETIPPTEAPYILAKSSPSEEELSADSASLD